VGPVEYNTKEAQSSAVCIQVEPAASRKEISLGSYNSSKK